MTSYSSITEVPDHKHYISYNNIHKLCKKSAELLHEKNEVPDIIIAIGGGGFIPARILRLFLKKYKGHNIPIQAIGLSLYEDFGGSEKIGAEVVRTQWLDFSSLDPLMFVGKKLLIVDEVDDTRTTLHYAYRELEQDLREREGEEGGLSLGIFVLHNKDKPKKAELPQNVIENRYWAALTLKDAWIVYPWDAEDIDLHTRYAELQGYV